MNKHIKTLTLFSGIHSEFATILIGHRATLEKVEQLGSIKWYDDAADRWTNRSRMKELGGALMSYQRFLYDSSVMSIANAVERTCIWLKQDFGIRWDIFKNFSKTARFQETAREFRSLANIIKHNSGYIDRTTSIFSKYLVDERGFPDGIPLDFLLPPSPNFNYPFEPNACRVFVFCVELLAELAGIKNPFHNLSDNEIVLAIPKMLIPDVLQLKTPTV
jgi:hypothetical protein